MELTAKQWAQFVLIIQQTLPSKILSGLPRQDDRSILNGILWICRKGAPWKYLPGRYPSDQSCHRRFKEWLK